MAIEIRETTTAADIHAGPLANIRWSAIFAGLAVGVGMHLLLTLIGAAAGFAVYSAGQHPEGQTISIAAGIWNTLSMLISALVGGYVAGRACGLRRTGDGMLHGMVAWGATMLFFTAVLSSTAFSGMFGMVNPPQAVLATRSGGTVESPTSVVLSSLERGDRSTAISTLQKRFGFSDEQANSFVDQALAISKPAQASAEGQANVEEKAGIATAASAWLSIAILLSLVAGAGGGIFGVHGVDLRDRKTARYIQNRTATITGGPHIPSRG